MTGNFWIYVVEMQAELREFKDKMERMEKRLSEVELLKEDFSNYER